MFVSKTSAMINILAGTGVVTGLVVGEAIPDAAETSQGANLMDWLNYYSDALGSMFAGITCAAFIGFNIWRMIRERKDK